MSIMKGTKGDMYFKQIAEHLLYEGCLDKNPRPRWEDGTPAHTLSLNGFMCQYDISRGESPLLTLRPIAIKGSIGELLWIYQDQSNALDLLKEKYGIGWWDEWAVKGTRHIGACYGETVRRHDLMNNLLEGIRQDPDGRRHIIDMWQVDDFKEPHGLKPCCYMTNWNVRHSASGIDYLDMAVYQRSSDFGVAGCINQFQYYAFLLAVAKVLNYSAGVFTWFAENVQIYDKHIPNIKNMLCREPLECHPILQIGKEETNWYETHNSWYDLKVEDFILTGYPKELIQLRNPQLKFPVAV